MLEKFYLLVAPKSPVRRTFSSPLYAYFAHIVVASVVILLTSEHEDQNSRYRSLWL